MKPKSIKKKNKKRKMLPKLGLKLRAARIKITKRGGIITRSIGSIPPKITRKEDSRAYSKSSQNYPKLLEV